MVGRSVASRRKFEPPLVGGQTRSQSQRKTSQLWVGFKGEGEKARKVGELVGQACEEVMRGVQSLEGGELTKFWWEGCDLVVVTP
jgi:hypothetical protein